MTDEPPAPLAAVVLNWNGREDTRRAVASLLGAPRPERVWVVDNGSEAGEAGALAGDFAAEPRVTVVPLPRNVGFAAGVNEGVRRARAAGAASFLLLNNDATMEPGALPLLEAALAGDPEAAAVGPRILLDDGSGRTWSAGGSLVPCLGEVRHAAGGSGEGARTAGPRATGFLTFCAVLVRGEAWDRVGPLDEEFFAYFEDADWCHRAAAAGSRLLHHPGATVLHRGGAAAGVRSPLQQYLLTRGSVLFARKRCGPLARLLLFWPYMFLLRAPHDALKALLTRGGRAAAAVGSGLRDGIRGGAPTLPATEPAP